ncbi:hypothetical protein GWK47_033718 [Chionoecetes opilio]|uniref:Reverse transcriptase domain-containing protein n=1 Tax=Chionoecetes opilio TaxID=41210 RepID=A0A8J4YJJ1_CHIOP|nr:hypothetical protein GWK47_033718 [Chionoecetes opilio]
MAGLPGLWPPIAGDCPGIAGAFDCVWHKASWQSLNSSASRDTCWRVLELPAQPESEGGGEWEHVSHVPGGGSVSTGSVLSPILWNIYFNTSSKAPVASAYADDCTVVPYLHQRGDAKRDRLPPTVNLVTSRPGEGRWQVKFAAEKAQAMVISRSRRTPGYSREAEVWGRYPCHQELHQHPGGGGCPPGSLDCHLGQWRVEPP